MTNNRQDRVAKIEAKYKKRAQAVKEKINKTKSSGKHTVDTNRLELMITIVGRNKAEFYADLIQSFDVNMQMIALATGTANERMLGLLGLTDNEKAVLFSVIREEKINDALHVLGEKFKTIKDGKGVAFTIPLTSVIGTLIYGFLSNNRTVVKEK